VVSTLGIAVGWVEVEVREVWLQPANARPARTSENKIEFFIGD